MKILPIKKDCWACTEENWFLKWLLSSLTSHIAESWTDPGNLAFAYVIRILESQHYERNSISSKKCSYQILLTVRTFKLWYPFLLMYRFPLWISLISGGATMDICVPSTAPIMHGIPNLSLNLKICNLLIFNYKLNHQQQTLVEFLLFQQVFAEILWWLASSYLQSNLWQL